MIKTISYLGLGTTGSGMASNLLKAGYTLSVWNRNGEKCEPFARKGARVADTPANAVRDVDLVMYSLSNDQAVEEVVFGANGILSGINAGRWNHPLMLTLCFVCKFRILRFLSGGLRYAPGFF